MLVYACLAARLPTRFYALCKLRAMSSSDHRQDVAFHQLQHDPRTFFEHCQCMTSICGVKLIQNWKKLGEVCSSVEEGAIQIAPALHNNMNGRSEARSQRVQFAIAPIALIEARDFGLGNSCPHRSELGARVRSGKQGTRIHRDAWVLG